MSAEVEILEPGELTMPERAVRANRLHRLASGAIASWIEYSVGCGDTLAGAKAQLRHGEWLPWLDENFEGSRRLAQMYMRLAANAKRVAHLPPGTSLRRALEAVSSESNGDRARDERPSVPQTVTVALSDLTRHKRSTREDPPDLVEHIAESLRKTGYHDEVVVARDNTILKGESVVLAAELLGLNEIDVRRLDYDPDDHEALKIMALDYAAGKRAMVDDWQFARLLKQLYEDGGLEGTGYAPEMVANLAMISRPAAEIADLNEAMEWMGIEDFERVEQPWTLTLNFDNTDLRDKFVTYLRERSPGWTFEMPRHLRIRVRRSS